MSQLSRENYSTLSLAFFRIRPVSNQISVVVNDNRARNIAIGFVVVAVLTYWHFTGSLPLLATSMVPQPVDDRLRSTWSFGVELLGDLFYFVGVATTGFVSGIWSLLIGLIRLLVNKSSDKVAAVSQEQTVTRDLLDQRTKQVFAAIEAPLNDLSLKLARIEDRLERGEVVDALTASIATTPQGPYRAATQPTKPTRTVRKKAQP